MLTQHRDPCDILFAFGVWLDDCLVTHNARKNTNLRKNIGLGLPAAPKQRSPRCLRVRPQNTSCGARFPGAAPAPVQPRLFNGLHLWRRQPGHLPLTRPQPGPRRCQRQIRRVRPQSSAALNQIVSVALNGRTGNRLSWTSTVSMNGRRILFSSKATNLVPGDSAPWLRLRPHPLNAAPLVFTRAETASLGDARNTTRGRIVAVAANGALGAAIATGSLPGDCTSPKDRHLRPAEARAGQARLIATSVCVDQIQDHVHRFAVLSPAHLLRRGFVGGRCDDGSQGGRGFDASTD